MYDDEYKTCAQTYATLCIYGLSPEDVTAGLGLTATIGQHQGDLRYGARATVDGWFLGSKGLVESKDLRRHLDWVLDQLLPQREALEDLVRRGARVAMSCYWLSALGQGGPMVSPTQSKKLGDLGIEIWFDLYVSRADVDPTCA